MRWRRRVGSLEYSRRMRSLIGVMRGVAGVAGVLCYDYQHAAQDAHHAKRAGQQQRSLLAIAGRLVLRIGIVAAATATVAAAAKEVAKRGQRGVRRRVLVVLQPLIPRDIAVVVPVDLSEVRIVDRTGREPLLIGDSAVVVGVHPGKVGGGGGGHAQGWLIGWRLPSFQLRGAIVVIGALIEQRASVVMVLMRLRGTAMRPFGLQRGVLLLVI